MASGKIKTGRFSIMIGQGVIETSCYFFIVDFSFKMHVEIDRYPEISRNKYDVLYRT